MEELTVYRDEGSIDIYSIESFERTISFCFPHSYKRLISLHNELRPAKDIFNFINVYEKEDERDIHFFGYGTKKSYNIEKEQQISDSQYYGVKGLVAFGGCANGDYICFDYREDPQTCNPKVVLVYHDDYTENEDGTSSMTVNFVANSFEEFIDILYEDDE